ncbi:MAG: carbohydrate porin [Planctomycetes bacterium]|nr:carbohydrate porin [Planctomycetota bacterium]
MNKTLILLSVAVLLCAAAVAQAQDSEMGQKNAGDFSPQIKMTSARRLLDDPLRLRELDHFLGDLHGLRPWLDSKGVTSELIYSGEVFKNMRGGLNTHNADKYRGNFDFTLSVDTERLGLQPGRIFFYTQFAHGTGITANHVGDAQTLSNLDATYLFQVSEYWIDQLFYDGRLRFKLGKMDSNVDFMAVDYGGDFSQSSFAVIPTAPTPTFPDPALGAAVFWEPEDWISMGAGVYEGGPDGRSSGFNTAFDSKSHHGMFSIYEVALKPKISFGAQKDMPGTYRIGAWHHSDEFDEVGDGASEVFKGNHGFYLAFDQMLYQEKSDSEQGLGAFLQFGWAPENRNEINRYFGGGLSYVGLIPGRDEDTVGMGLAQALWSDQIDNFSKETAIELFYKAQLSEFVSVKPDIHYIANPGGGDTIKDALAFGLRFEILF